jgi:hypothetical protein
MYRNYPVAGAPGCFMGLSGLFAGVGSGLDFTELCDFLLVVRVLRSGFLVTYGMVIKINT